MPPYQNQYPQYQQYNTQVPAPMDRLAQLQAQQQYQMPQQMIPTQMS